MVIARGGHGYEVESMPVNTESRGAQDSGAFSNGEPAEPCPPPLAWQEVLGEFHSQAEVWYLERPGYRLTGRMLGNGPPLYLLNGFGGTHEIYALLVWLLRDRFRCVVWDYPGTSVQTTTEETVTLDDLSDDLAAVAETCGDLSIDVYAPSFGSLVALNSMLRHSPLVRRAVLQGGFAHRRLSRFESWLARSCRFFPGPVKRFPGSRAVREHNHRRWFPPFDTTRWQFLEDTVGRVPVRALAWQAALVRDMDLRSLLSDVRQPILLVETEGEGRATRTCQQELSNALPNAKIETILGTGQYPQLTHPHRLAKVLRQFLDADA